MEIKLPLSFSLYVSIRSNGQIENKLPNELLKMIFSYLPNNALAVTSSTCKRWNNVTLDTVRMQEAKLFKSYIRMVADAIAVEKIKTKVENLLAEVKLSEDVIVNLSQLKNTFLNLKNQLDAILMELEPVTRNKLIRSMRNVPKPSHFSERLPPVQLRFHVPLNQPIYPAVNIFNPDWLRDVMDIYFDRNRFRARVIPLEEQNELVEDMSDFLSRIFRPKEIQELDVD